MASALSGQYRTTFSTVRPGNDLKLPFLTALRRVDLAGEPTVQWRYSMSARVGGRSYAICWYSVERVMGVPDGGHTAGAWIVAGTVRCAVGGTVGRYAGTGGGASGRYCWTELSSLLGMMCDWCSCGCVALHSSGGC